MIRDALYADEAKNIRTEKADFNFIPLKHAIKRTYLALLFGTFVATI